MPAVLKPIAGHMQALYTQTTKAGTLLGHVKENCQKSHFIRLHHYLHSWPEIKSK